jgi:predicted ATPase
VRDWQPPVDVFVGRTAELERVAEILRRSAEGQPWLVAIEGDPGMGKTALARRALEGTRVLSARAGQAEADLDYGILDQLLRSAGRVIPEIQLGADPPASSFAVGARLLQVVDELQDAGPLAIEIEDLQWADRPSAEALTFMLRRLSVDRVVTVVTYRGNGHDLDPAAQRLLASVEHRDHLVLGGLSLDEVAELAATVTATPLDEQAVHQLYLATGGHPLYVRTVLTEGSGTPARYPGRLSVPHSLADAIGDQLRALPPDTRAVLEMLAVLNVRIPLAQLGQAAQERPGADPAPAGPGRHLRRDQRDPPA